MDSDLELLIGKMADTRMHNFNEKWDLIVNLRRKLFNDPPTSIYTCRPLLDFIHDFHVWIMTTPGALDNDELAYAVEVATTCQSYQDLVTSVLYILEFLYNLGVKDQ